MHFSLKDFKFFLHKSGQTLRMEKMESFWDSLSSNELQMMCKAIDKSVNSNETQLKTYWEKQTLYLRPKNECNEMLTKSFDKRSHARDRDFDFILYFNVKYFLYFICKKHLHRH